MRRARNVSDARSRASGRGRLTQGSEAAWQRQIEQLARLYLWTPYHTHDSRRSAPGFPDLVLVRPPDLIFAELKTDTGRVRPEQRIWLDLLGRVPGVEVYLWRPRDFEAVNNRLAEGRNKLDRSASLPMA